MTIETLEAALRKCGASAGMIIYSGPDNGNRHETLSLSDFAARLLPLLSEWQPIESAPKDGEPLIGYFPEFENMISVFWWEPTIQTWDWQGNSDDCSPVLWARIFWPLPPATTQASVN